MGLHRAGFEVVGVDIEAQPHYPFEFHQADALTFPLDGFDFIWASPPCQAHSKTRAITGKTYPDLIPQTRARLKEKGGLWAIENVPGAPLHNPIMLCGTMFGLQVIRHRHFETSFPMFVPECGKHGSTNSHRGYSTGAEFVTVAGNNYRRVEGAAAMGMTDWYMPRDRLSQAIPPAYSEFIGRAALNQLRQTAAVGELIGALAEANAFILAPAEDLKDGVLSRVRDALQQAVAA
jgi:DNA (cytosine-5)-methyltransferase 1